MQIQSIYFSPYSARTFGYRDPWALGREAAARSGKPTNPFLKTTTAANTNAAAQKSDDKPKQKTFDSKEAELKYKRHKQAREKISRELKNCENKLFSEYQKDSADDDKIIFYNKPYDYNAISKATGYKPDFVWLRMEYDSVLKEIKDTILAHLNEDFDEDEKEVLRSIIKKMISETQVRSRGEIYRELHDRMGLSVHLIYDLIRCDKDLRAELQDKCKI